eukprot:GHRR01032734.1.p1 GENE.GHRR01032734.1~~GHRR01032734.1.p1  ORF type:complete len:109 (+),score=8.84 GHRR01032734.1:374-700(+)
MLAERHPALQRQQAFISCPSHQPGSSHALMSFKSHVRCKSQHAHHGLSKALSAYCMLTVIAAHAMVPIDMFAMKHAPKVTAVQACNSSGTWLCLAAPSAVCRPVKLME